ncbi:MAG TPA: hypothetical protein VFO77_00080, partial [Actinoplanes sp.]|nr:hypothetical protein [Actinoplanes sp.]
DVTQLIPPVPVIEGYAAFGTGPWDGPADSTGPWDGRADSTGPWHGRADSTGPWHGPADGIRARETDGPPRPRPRPRPRPSGQAGNDRQSPARSTVYVSRHAAEPG